MNGMDIQKIIALLEEVIAMLRELGVPGVAEATPKPKRKLAGETAAFRRFTDYFCQQWQQAHQAKYPFQNSKDGAAAAGVWNYAEKDMARAKQIVNNYFACTEPFFAEHTLAKLNSQLAKFVGTDLDELADVTRGGGRALTQAERDLLFGDPQKANT